MTSDEFMRLPDNGLRYELVAGEAKASPAFSLLYGVLVCRLAMLLAPYVKGRGYMTTGKAGFHTVNGNIRCPTLSFTRKERFSGGKPPNTFGTFAPDLCVEIISPSEERADMRRKVEEYFASGAEQVWQLFPETQTLTVYTSLTTAAQFSAEDEVDGGSLLPGFRCQVAQLFDVE